MGRRGIDLNRCRFDLRQGQRKWTIIGYSHTFPFKPRQLTRNCIKEHEILKIWNFSPLPFLRHVRSSHKLSWRHHGRTSVKKIELDKRPKSESGPLSFILDMICDTLLSVTPFPTRNPIPVDKFETGRREERKTLV